MRQELYNAVLLGLELQRTHIEKMIADLHRASRGREIQATSSVVSIQRHRLSEKGRRNLSRSMKKRWALARKNHQAHI